MIGLERHWTRRCMGLAALAATLCVAGAARAHIDLTTPIPREQGLSREPNSDLKQGPCGQVENGRTSKVNVFAPGETIEVTWRETTNHRSYYRVAFDRVGDDALPAFEGPGTGAQGIDPSGPCPVDGQVVLAYDMDDRSGGSHTLSVRLPDIECESCTLQVVQFMYDTRSPYYFQCADLALRGSGASDAGAPEARDAGLDRAAPDAGVEREPSAAAGCWSRIAPSDPTPTGDDDGSADTEPSSADRPTASPSDQGASEPSAMTPRRAPRSDGGLCSIEPPTSFRVTSIAALLLFAGSLMSRHSPSRHALMQSGRAARISCGANGRARRGTLQGRPVSTNESHLTQSVNTKRLRPWFSFGPFSPRPSAA